jgi:hypothetical protein
MFAREASRSPERQARDIAFAATFPRSSMKFMSSSGHLARPGEQTVDVALAPRMGSNTE